mgnify:CR=1 FL=1
MTSTNNVFEYYRETQAGYIMAKLASKLKLELEIILVANGFRQITSTLVKKVDVTFSYINSTKERNFKNFTKSIDKKIE